MPLYFTVMSWGGIKKTNKIQENFLIFKFITNMIKTADTY